MLYTAYYIKPKIVNMFFRTPIVKNCDILFYFTKNKKI